ncbi:TerC family protein [Rhodomicrobium vannielii ATCC 17100]|uniref:TerC family protein n=1 Tax=Rhodomicrobium vannielii TaxID=1069 RepID=UPI001919E7AF|nr:TerC family protein [Rhodomicrobium vannielii]MBJ7535337.1 TerC family protein [Rhodomicrobium vannielii ATCC 17100]
MFEEHSIWAWLGFTALILAILAADLGLFHRKARAIPVREALIMTAGYIALALCFNAWIYFEFGNQKAVEFLTGYFIEYALSMDNILVFVIIFTYFQVPSHLQMRVLLWGILAALVLRGVFILAGYALIENFHFTVLFLGAFLVYTGFKTMASGEEAVDLENSRIVKWTRRVLPMTTDYHGERFFVRLSGTGKRVATPLFLVLIVLNITDIVFALDSIPAIFAITRDPFIVYTSNVFAILGLRALFFALRGMVDKFRYLKYGLSLTLVFIGFKMIFNYPEEWPDIPTEWALGMTAILIFGSIGLSLLKNRAEEKATSQ